MEAGVVAALEPPLARRQLAHGRARGSNDYGSIKWVAFYGILEQDRADTARPVTDDEPVDIKAVFERIWEVLS